MPIAQVNGLNIGYDRTGQGEPLVLLHGIGGNARSWRYQLAGLSDEFTVIAWDAPGYGRSSDPPGPCAMDDYAAYLAGLLDQLGLEHAHVLGLSWGGVLAQTFYRRHSERMPSLILADTTPGHASLSEAERERRLQARLRALETMTPIEMARARAPVLLSPNAPADLLREVESIMAEIHLEGYRLAAIALSQADELDTLPRIAVPTLVVCGEFDRVTPPEQARQIEQAIPGARLALITRAGHVSNQEQPERFNAVVREFLREVSSPQFRVSGPGVAPW